MTADSGCDLQRHSPILVLVAEGDSREENAPVVVHFDVDVDRTAEVRDDARGDLVNEQNVAAEQGEEPNVPGRKESE